MYTDKQVDDILAYITITKDYDYAQNTLNILSKCKCCSVHNHNKPTIFQPWFEMTYKPDVKGKNCYCNCRHVSRFICRLSTDNIIGKQQNPRPYTSKKNNNHNQSCLPNPKQPPIQRPEKSPPKSQPIIHTRNILDYEQYTQSQANNRSLNSLDYEQYTQSQRPNKSPPNLNTNKSSKFSLFNTFTL